MERRRRPRARARAAPRRDRGPDLARAGGHGRDSTNRGRRPPRRSRGAPRRQPPGHRRLAIERDAVTSAAAAPGAKAGPSVLRPAPLRADPGQQQDRPRHQLAQAGDEAGLGRADHRPRPAERARAAEPVGERRRPCSAIRSWSGTPPASAVEEVGGAGVRGPDEEEDAGAGARPPPPRAARASRRRSEGWR